MTWTCDYLVFTLRDIFCDITKKWDRNYVTVKFHILCHGVRSIWTHVDTVWTHIFIGDVIEGCYASTKCKLFLYSVHEILQDNRLQLAYSFLHDPIVGPSYIDITVKVSHLKTMEIAQQPELLTISLLTSLSCLLTYRGVYPPLGCGSSPPPLPQNYGLSNPLQGCFQDRLKIKEVQ